MSRAKNSCSGQALVEFIVLVPVMILLFYLMLSLNDIAFTRIKVSQISRYSTFAFADTPGSSYNPIDEGWNEGPSTFKAYVEKVNLFNPSFPIPTQVGDIWSDLDPTTKFDNLTSLFKQGNSDYKLVINTGTYQNGDAPVMYTDGTRFLDELGINTSVSSNQALSKALRSAASVFSGILKAAEFNTKGMITTSASLEMHNNLADIPLLKMVVPETVTLTSSLTMLTDSWKLEDGRDVHSLHSNKRQYSSANKNKNSWDKARTVEKNLLGDKFLMTAFHRQIKNMWLATFDPAKSLGDAVGQKFNKSENSDETNSFLSQLVGGVVDFALGAIPGQPFDVRVASHAYGYKTDDENSGMVDVFDIHGAKGFGSVEKFHTLPMVTNANAPKDNEYYKTFKKRGDYFMGCKKSQQRGCTYE